MTEQGHDPSVTTPARRITEYRKSDQAGDSPIFHSILFPPGLEGARYERADEPDCFTDLNLDQVTAAIVARRDEDFLRPLFYSTYRDEEIIRYRQAIFADLEHPDVFPVFPEFCDAMWTVRAILAYARKITYKRHMDMVIIRAIALYCETVANLARRLQPLPLQSAGLTSLLAYVASYASSQTFVNLVAETQDLRAFISKVGFGTPFRGAKVQWRKFASDRD